MNRYCLAFVGFTLSAFTACHKAIPVALVPPPTPPAQIVQKEEPKPAPAPVKVATTRTPLARPAKSPVEPAKQMTAQERLSLEQRLMRLEDALFDYDRASIRPDAMNTLRSDVEVIRGILANYPSQKLVIEGHADDRGSSEYNLGLGDKRATSAEEFLNTLGVPRAQLTVISYGKDRPVCSQQDEACWQKNRRVHITAAP